MTAQQPDYVDYEGETRITHADPLGPYFSRACINPSFGVPSSSLYDGYYCKWTVQQDRLYLIGVDGMFEDRSTVTLWSFFPQAFNKVFAHWFSGVVTVDDGALLDRGYVQFGIGRIFERKIHLVFRRGVLVETHIQPCSVPPPSEKVPVAIEKRSWWESMVLSVKERFEKTPKSYPETRKWYGVEPCHLKQRFALEEIEARETVVDPLQTAPAVPFGFYQHSWQAFMTTHQPGDDLWWFESREEGIFRAGYARVRNGKLGEHFIVEKFNLREEPLSPYFSNSGGYK